MCNNPSAYSQSTFGKINVQIRKTENVPVYVHEVRGTNVKKFGQAWCNEVRVETGGDINKKFHISFHTRTTLSPGKLKLSRPTVPCPFKNGEKIKKKVKIKIIIIIMIIMV